MLRSRFSGALKQMTINFYDFTVNSLRTNERALIRHYTLPIYTNYYSYFNVDFMTEDYNLYAVTYMQMMANRSSGRIKRLLFSREMRDRRLRGEF